MKVQIPFSSKSEKLISLFQKIQEQGVPSEKVDSAFIKKMGFPASASASLVEVLRLLGFIDENGRASGVWSDFSGDKDYPLKMARIIQTAYAGLFKEVMCPYLADNETLFEYMKNNTDLSRREMEYALETFRVLCSMADFQEQLGEYDFVEPFKEVQPPDLPGEITDELSSGTAVKVNPNLQLNIQIHIDAATPDEKIETIFKYMRRYLLDK